MATNDSSRNGIEEAERAYQEGMRWKDDFNRWLSLRMDYAYYTEDTGRQAAHVLMTRTRRIEATPTDQEVSDLCLDALRYVADLQRSRNALPAILDEGQQGSLVASVASLCRGSKGIRPFVVDYEPSSDPNLTEQQENLYIAKQAVELSLVAHTVGSLAKSLGFTKRAFDGMWDQASQDHAYAAISIHHGVLLHLTRDEAKVVAERAAASAMQTLLNPQAAPGPDGVRNPERIKAAARKVIEATSAWKVAMARRDQIRSNFVDSLDISAPQQPLNTER